MPSLLAFIFFSLTRTYAFFPGNGHPTHCWRGFKPRQQGCCVSPTNYGFWCMRNGTLFPNKLIFGLSLKICVITGLCCYVLLLGIIELAHDHTEHAHCEDTCTACFFSSQHVSVEVESFVLDSPFFIHTELRLYEEIFLPLKRVIHTRSRAPPVFSTELANYAF